MTEPAPMLPGLALPDRVPTAIEVEARAHLEHLAASGLLRVEHRLAAQLVLDLARTVGLGARTGKAAGVALAARQLMDAMDRLPSPPDPATLDDFARVVEVIEGGTAAP